MREIKSYRRVLLIIWVVIYESQKQNFATWGNIFFQKTVESRIFLILIKLEIMIFVEFRLPQDFISHRPKIVSQGLYHFWILMEL